MADVLPDLPLPARCTECGEPWTGYSARDDEEHTITLRCRAGHELETAVSRAQLEAFGRLSPRQIFGGGRESVVAPRLGTAGTRGVAVGASISVEPKEANETDGAAG